MVQTRAPYALVALCALACTTSTSGSDATDTDSVTGDGTTGAIASTSGDGPGATATSTPTPSDDTPPSGEGNPTMPPGDTTIGDGGPPPDPSTCEAEPPCAGVKLSDPMYLMEGWAMGGDGEPLRIMLSNPGTECGNVDPGGCTDCGNFERVDIELPPEAQAPGTYGEADGVSVACSSILTDCGGNGEGDGGPATDPVVEIVSIDAGCVVGELAQSDCGSDTGQFAVIRCPR